MRAAASASQSVEFGKQWLSQSVDGRFSLEQYLGGSADTAVFLTRVKDAKAAIKLVSASSVDPDAQLASWRRAAKLSHPNLIRITDCGRCWLSGNELLYVVTDYADETLAQVLPNRSISADEAEGLIRPALDVLTYLQRQGLVHGSISPSNIMAVNEQVMLSSDSIQAAGSSRANRLASPYEAPEAVAGQLSPAADVWSLGATLAHALTQRVPQRDKKFDSSTLPQPFADIVRYSLRTTPSSRWTLPQISARLNGKAVPAQTPEADVKPAASAPEKSSVNRLLRLPIAAVVLLAVVIGYAVLHRRSPQPAPASTAPTSSTAETTPPPTMAPAQPAPVSSSSAAASQSSVSNRVLPKPSAGALHTIHGHIKVRIRANVDSSGNVTHARFISSGSSKYFARLAMEAAQQWKFTPVPGEWNLLFEFSRGGVNAEASAAKR